MKKFISSLLIFTLIAILFTNCEKENNIEITQNSAKENPYNVKTVKLSEIPKIRDFILDKTNDNLFTKSTEIDGAIFDDDNILEVIDTLNNTNYSFRFIYPDTPVGTFYNLIVGKTPGGENITPYVLKYVCETGQLEAFVNNNFNFEFFKGVVSIHKYTDFFEVGSILKTEPNCPPNNDENGDPIPCENFDADGSSTNGSSGGTADSSENNPSGDGTTYNSTGDPNPGGDGTSNDSGGSTAGDSNSGGGSGSFSPCITSECFPSWYDCQEYIVYINPDCLNNDEQIAPKGDNNTTISSKAGGNCPDCTSPSGGVGVLTNNSIWTIETVLFTNVSDPVISNITDYLKCFNVNQGATLTIYADQPTTNSSATWSVSLSGPDVGHTFISISQNGIIRTLGYYPMPNTINPAAGNITSTSLLRNNENHHYDVSASISITGTQLSTIINNITSYSSTYNLNTNNCTDFGISLSNSVGMNISDTSGTWPFGGNGSNPGNLGQDIRKLNNSNASINNLGGSAPTNSGTCN